MAHAGQADRGMPVSLFFIAAAVVAVLVFSAMVGTGGAVYRTLGISLRRELRAAMRDPTALVRDSATQADLET